MNNTTCPPAQPHLNVELFRAALGPGLQVAVGEGLLHLLSEPVVCKN